MGGASKIEADHFELDALCKSPSLAFIFDMFQEILEGVNILHELSLRRQDMGVLQDVIADAQVFRHPLTVFEL
jgi:hypothetical protein